MGHWWMGSTTPFEEVSQDLVTSYCRQAETKLKSARIRYDDWSWALCVQDCQQAVELSIKALFKRYVGDFPKRHDPGAELFEHVSKFPEPVGQRLARIWFASKVLASWREPFTYGLEAGQVPPEKIFTKKEAELALGLAEEVLYSIRPHIP